jgi:hypothetical protein
VLYELDGGARTKVRRLKIRLRPAAVTIAVPGVLAAEQPTRDLVALSG